MRMDYIAASLQFRANTGNGLVRPMGLAGVVSGRAVLHPIDGLDMAPKCCALVCPAAGVIS